MPHVILAGNIDLQEIFAGFAKMRSQKLGWLVKIDKCFLSNERKTLLLDCTAVRSGFSQDFYLRIEDKGTVTVRVDPYMRIERNDGVQIAVGTAAAWVKTQADANIEKTNLPPHVIEELL